MKPTGETRPNRELPTMSLGEGVLFALVEVVILWVIGYLVFA